MPTTPCPKCSGFLMPEYSWDDQTGRHLPMIYCLNCGLRADREITYNRVNPITPPDTRTLPRMVGTSCYVAPNAKKPGPPKGYRQTFEHLANRHGEAASV